MSNYEGLLTQMDRLSDRFDQACRNLDHEKVPYVAYLYDCGYLRYRVGRGPRPKSTAIRIEADIKRLQRQYRLRKVVRSDGTTPTVESY